VCADVKLVDTGPYDRPEVDRKATCTAEEVGDFIQKHVPSAYLVADTATELHYTLPFEEAKKGNFKKLFQVQPN
jgi:hypothetical protein